MANRVKSYLDSKELDNFLSYSAVSNLGLFSGPQGIDNLISDYIKQREEAARQEGVKEVIEKLVSRIRAQTENYMLLITRIVDFIYELIGKDFKEKDIKIIEARTNFYLETQWINVLFVIDADSENELAFSQMLSDIQRFILEKEHHIAEIFYVNTRDATIDKDSVYADYPYIRKIGIKS